MGRRAKGARWYWIGVLAAFLLLVRAAPDAWAQDYKFSLDRNISRVVVNRDGSADIEYWLTFTCAQGAHPIDIVDVGLPNDTYRLNSAQAWYSSGIGDGDGVPLTDIRKAEYLDVGIEVHLKGNTIQPGEQGTVHVRVNVAEMVYPDQDEAYASVEFAPTYYGSQYVQGKTYLEIQFLFPPGVTNEETRWHSTEPDEFDLVGDRIVFIYQYPDARGDETHQHGISFPRTYVDQVNKAPVVVSTGGSSTDSDLGGVCVCFGVFAFFGGTTALSIFQSRKRKLAYLPPALSVEGVGIKRGLTAVEAAILLEQALNKVLTMIMFGLLKKRAIVVKEEEPLLLGKVDPLPTRKYRAYENRFLEAIQADGTLEETKLQEAIITLVKDVNKKLKGFSRKETVTYYRSIVDRAWDQVQSGDTPELKSRYFDQGLEWMMMDEKFETRTERTFSSGPVFMPPWWAHYRPWVSRVQSTRTGSATTRTSSQSSSGGRQVTLPTLPGAAFASTLVSGMERTAGGIVGRLERFTSGVTSKTNPLPKGSSSGRSYKSGGCACACACACAGCACACAGGGR
jgi:hypothetical protein